MYWRITFILLDFSSKVATNTPFIKKYKEQYGEQHGSVILLLCQMRKLFAT
jgi:hypothetical protein